MDKWDQHLQDLQKRLNKKEKKLLRQINKEYKEVSKELIMALTEMYMRLEKNGELSYSDAVRFNDITRLKQNVVYEITALVEVNKERVLTILDETYFLSYAYMSYVIEKESSAILKAVTPDMPRLQQQLFDNPIRGLKLEPALERDRRMIVSDINRAIERGLIDGKTYGSIAKNIQEVFESSFKRAVNIAHTETHRVREQATHESAMNADRQGVKMVKIWRNMADERVRKKKQANHRSMEGQTKPVSEPYELKPSGQTDSPGNSRIASQDIRCRCYSSHRVSHLEGAIPKKPVISDFDGWLMERTPELVPI
ncbi:hypothetical protein ABE28_008940 [Peribacillus muralis]|uniref:Phage head morphogenesis domain-containing protein n=1 Tax=Peribacillus muralis TaxID=264697 RepID=A0A1B3XMP3_9BACI|nr:phage minor head protein [Peribacillus muralis]AOH54477.1 hypothetical protein ABE28_008940 [Peribacillus muralis]